MTSFTAADRPLPQVAYYSVEYPGYVKSSSVSLAIRNLGGQALLDQAFRRGSQKSDSLVELSFCPDNSFVHPVPGEVVGSNKLLLKLVKRKRKVTDSSSPTEEVRGEYTAHVVGMVAKTARFRSMADFQFHPDLNDPVSELRDAMNRMDVEQICSYRVPPGTSDNDLPSKADSVMDIDPEILGISRQSDPTFVPEGLRLFPPPLFSRQHVPQGYNFKTNPASIIATTIDDHTGEEQKRVINRMRWKGYGPASIMFTDTQVPAKPPASVEGGRRQISETLLARLNQIFATRPVWTRAALFNQFTALEAREIHNSKLVLPSACYVFQDGPWRDTLVRFSYDPRKDPDARIYQRIYFRNSNHPISRPSVAGRRQAPTDERSTEQDRESRSSHIFDGQTLSKETAAFQLCDITDHMLKEMIEDPEALRETCDERDGWYTTHALEAIKTVLRHKFFSLLEGHLVSDDDCKALLVANEGPVKASTTNRSSKLRAGKHNMAKGALRPEDAAALRLRATLNRSIKSLHSRRGQ